MMLLTGFFLSVFVASCYSQDDVEASERVEYCLNLNKTLQVVSDKFLSISIDPVTLFGGEALNYSTVILANNLSPGYIRIAGPSTEHLQYYEEDGYVLPDSKSINSTLNFTGPMLGDVIEWFASVNMTPVFAVNDVNGNNPWNPEEWRPIFEAVAELNNTCYWQMGWNASSKFIEEYTYDLKALKVFISTFDHKRYPWKIVGSDTSEWTYSTYSTMIGFLRNDVDSVMWEPSAEVFPQEIKNQTEFSKQNKVEMWTSAPKYDKPITWKCALNWGKNIGDVAKLGYSVLFRQPSNEELVSATPIYWVSLLHKRLMGTGVFNITRSSSLKRDLHVYAHCASKQMYPNSGITFMVINNGTETRTVSFKLHGETRENITIQAYLLNSSYPEENTVFLNGDPLDIALLKDNELFIPQSIAMKATPEVELEVPAQTVAFFVVPDVAGERCDPQNVAAPPNPKPPTKQKKRYHSSDKHEKLIKAMKSRMKRGINMDLLRVKSVGQGHRAHHTLEESPRAGARREIIVQPGFSRHRGISEYPRRNFGEAEVPTRRRFHLPKQVHRFKADGDEEDVSAAEDSQEALREAIEFLENAENQGKIDRFIPPRIQRPRQGDVVEKNAEESQENIDNMYDVPELPNSKEVFRDFGDDYFMEGDYNTFDFDERFRRNTNQEPINALAKTRATREASPQYRVVQQMNKEDLINRIRSRLQERRILGAKRLTRPISKLSRRPERQKRSTLDFQNYVSQTKGLKKWTPADMLRLREIKSRSILTNEIPQTVIYRTKREIDSSENAIDSNLNMLEQKTKSIPLAVLPSGDHFEINQFNGKRELKFVSGEKKTDIQRGLGNIDVAEIKVATEPTTSGDAKKTERSRREEEWFEKFCDSVKNCIIELKKKIEELLE